MNYFYATGDRNIPVHSVNKWMRNACYFTRSKIKVTIRVNQARRARFLELLEVPTGKAVD